jgi:hypothetical protein
VLTLNPIQRNVTFPLKFILFTSGPVLPKKCTQILLSFHQEKFYGPQYHHKNFFCVCGNLFSLLFYKSLYKILNLGLRVWLKLCRAWLSKHKVLKLQYSQKRSVQKISSKSQIFTICPCTKKKVCWSRTFTTKLCPHSTKIDRWGKNKWVWPCSNTTS